MLATTLGQELMLFGEWLHAVHTITYAHLPAWFLAFDVYELTAKHFWSVDRRNALIEKLGIETVPQIFSGRLALNQIEKLIGPSQLGAPRMEGLYLRREKNDYLSQRAKVVGAEFKQQIEAHWTRRALAVNHLLSAV